MDYFKKTELALEEQLSLAPDIKPKQTWYTRLTILWMLILWQISQSAIMIPMNKQGHFVLWKTGLFFVIFITCVGLSYQWARKYRLIPTINWRYFPLGKITAGFALMFATAAISALVMTVTHTKGTENQDMVDAIGKTLPPIVFFTMATSAGFFEELLFRVAPFELLFNKWPKIATIIAWGLFTAAHGPTDFASFTTYGLMSLVLTALYAKYRNFYLNMSVHFLWNAFAMISFFMTK